MTVASSEGSLMVMPLFRIPAPAGGSRQVVLPNDLAVRSESNLDRWSPVVRDAAESSLLVDAEGRVVALSRRAASQLGVEPVNSLGALLVDLVTMVDFSSGGAPLNHPELQVPPLKALRSGGMARGLVRLRRGTTGLVTYDMVGVSLDGGTGALGFLTEV